MAAESRSHTDTLELQAIRAQMDEGKLNYRRTTYDLLDSCERLLADLQRLEEALGQVRHAGHLYEARSIAADALAALRKEQ